MTGSAFLDAILGHFAGGGAFFTACGLLLTAVALRLIAWRTGGDPRGRAADRWSRTGVLAALVGTFVLIFSACPLPRWWYGVVFCTAAWWAFASRPTWPAGWRYGSTATLTAFLLWGVGWELTWFLSPTLPPAAERELLIVGDSITAGPGEEESLWPRRIVADRGLPVIVRAVAGARTADPLKGVGWDLPETGGVVLVELGGNDMLSGANPGQFLLDYRTLLERLKRNAAARGGTVVAVGLPLPPFHAAYGRAQRAACRQTDVPMIPRREFADVLFSPDATIDGLHLSEAGNDAMAEAMWTAIKKALPQASGRREPPERSIPDENTEG